MGERLEAGAIAFAIDDIFAASAAAPADQFAFKVTLNTIICSIQGLRMHHSNLQQTLKQPLQQLQLIRLPSRLMAEFA